MITSKHASLFVLAGLLGIAVTQPGCGSDTSGPTGSQTAGSSGAPATGTAGASTGASGSGSSGMASTTAGAPAAGAPAAGAPATGGGGSGGASGGSGGTGGGSAGTGGGSAGTGGKGGTGGTGGGSAGTGGGSAVAFADIKTIFSSSCATGTCHNSSSGQLDFKGTADLHALLTTPIPTTGVAHCNGTTLVTANNAANSFLVTVITGPGQVTCKKSGTDEKIGRMPEGCSTTSTNPRACLTAAQIKTITDWVNAGAPG